MKTQLLVTLAVAIFQFQGTAGQYTIQPVKSQSCTYDAFISSTPINGKVFLHPFAKSERVADWYDARGYCAKHCAEMVTVESEAENQLMLNFLKEVNNQIGCWLGAEIMDRTKFTKWNNGVEALYQPIKPGEYNEAGHTCASNWDFGQLGFCNDYCNSNRLIVCQRDKDWSTCECSE